MDYLRFVANESWHPLRRSRSCIFKDIQWRIHGNLLGLGNSENGSFWFWWLSWLWLGIRVYFLLHLLYLLLKSFFIVTHKVAIQIFFVLVHSLLAPKIMLRWCLSYVYSFFSPDRHLFRSLKELSVLRPDGTCFRCAWRLHKVVLDSPFLLSCFENRDDFWRSWMPRTRPHLLVIESLFRLYASEFWRWRIESRVARAEIFRSTWILILLLASVLPYFLPHSLYFSLEFVIAYLVDIILHFKLINTELSNYQIHFEFKIFIKSMRLFWQLSCLKAQLNKSFLILLPALLKASHSQSSGSTEWAASLRLTRPLLKSSKMLQVKLVTKLGSVLQNLCLTRQNLSLLTIMSLRQSKSLKREDLQVTIFSSLLTPLVELWVKCS